MDDRQLLELAAMAAGYVVRWYDDTLAYGPTFGIEVEPGNPCGFDPWNPLTDDGDALRLAVRLNIQIIPGTYNKEEFTAFHAEKGEVYEHRSYLQDEFTSTRRAIVRAAAEIGKAMQENN